MEGFGEVEVPQVGGGWMEQGAKRRRRERQEDAGCAPPLGAGTAGGGVSLVVAKDVWVPVLGQQGVVLRVRKCGWMR